MITGVSLIVGFNPGTDEGGGFTVTGLWSCGILRGIAGRGRFSLSVLVSGLKAYLLYLYLFPNPTSLKLFSRDT